MISFSNRISRTERKKLRGGKKTGIALSLALLLVCLIVGRSYREEIGRFLRDSILPSPDYARLASVADSLIVSTVSAFRLDHSPAESTVTRSDGLSHKRFTQTWPPRLPFEIFVQKLDMAARQRGFYCECVESKNRVDCSIILEDEIVGQITMESDRLARLAGRRLAIILKNPGSSINEQLSELAKSGVPLAYIGSPNTFPAGKIKNTLESAGVSTLLEVPGREAGVFKMLERKGKSPKKNWGDSDDLAADIILRHPDTAALFVDRAGGVDLPFIAAIMRNAQASGIAYLYENTRPDAVDSLAYSSGLRIVRMKNVAEFSNGKAEDFMTALTSELIAPGFPSEKTVIIDIKMIDFNSLLEMAGRFDEIGVKIMRYIELTDTTESLLRIN